MQWIWLNSGDLTVMALNSKGRGKQPGFTIIELLVAATIVCLLVVVAVASYQDHMKRKARMQASSALMELAESLQMQYARVGSYATSALPITQTPREGGAAYRISLAMAPVSATDPKVAFPASTATGFTLQAVPVNEDVCGTLLLDHTGHKGVVSSQAKLADCWPK
jgi:type IV pilus assembly protein PilE